MHRVWVSMVAATSPTRANLAKENCLDSATTAFACTTVNVTSEGRPYLGAALGTEDYMQSFVANKVQGWADELELLSIIAQSQPHAAHAAFTHGMTSKWSYLTRTMPNLGHCLSPREAVIRTPAHRQTTRPPNDMLCQHWPVQCPLTLSHQNNRAPDRGNSTAAEIINHQLSKGKIGGAHSEKRTFQTVIGTPE